ncbi:MAG: bifunctional riboflavin kinase/FAD synthetase [Candidatus Omnitrophica bacterium]|jgi:riboflavin kinase/FMN adenylyltransferase|nr:bifunctional riboflavin kinase/FAD synthetase [Candidatus Omnitrophota bacterium]
MKVVYKKLPSKKINCIATIGVFDGIHLGHRFILEKLKNLSLRQKIPSLVVTFDVLPQTLLEKSNRHKSDEFHGFLTDIEDRKIIFASLGIDYLWFLKTNKSFLRLSGKQFLEYLFRYFSPKHLLVGEDFRFGYKGKSCIRYLEKVSDKYGFDVTVLKKIRKNGRILSSSLIRHLIKNAAFGKIEKFLGRNYFIKGKIVKGSGLGRRLGYPTANIDYDGYVIPVSGVYSAIIETGNMRYLCAVNIGERPSINKSAEKILEAHIINFKRNILGEKIKLMFIERIRNEKKFSSKENLIKAITRDVSYVKKHYSKFNNLNANSLFVPTPCS